MACVIVNIGSNLGDRRLNLSRAVAAIGKAFGDFEISHVVESDPWGFDSTCSFLNVGMMFETDTDPLGLLRRLQEIERKISAAPHRDASGNYADREIDIDIIAVGDMIIDTEELQVPHPRMALREFVLRPLAELAPGWRHPATGLSPMEMLMNIRK